METKPDPIKDPIQVITTQQVQAQTKAATLMETKPVPLIAAITKAKPITSNCIKVLQTCHVEQDEDNKVKQHPNQ
jgi:hypothetical protein